jgi:hypothetical protein
MTDLLSDRNECRLGSRRSGHAYGLIHEILKIGPVSFETEGVYIREVIGNRIDIKLLGIHTTRSGV